MAEFRVYRSEIERMLHLRARTFAPFTDQSLRNRDFVGFVVNFDMRQDYPAVRRGRRPYKAAGPDVNTVFRETRKSGERIR